MLLLSGGVVELLADRDDGTEQRECSSKYSGRERMLENTVYKSRICIFDKP